MKPECNSVPADNVVVIFFNTVCGLTAILVRIQNT